MDFIIYTIKNILSPLFYKIATISICSSVIGIILLITNKIFKRKLSCKIKQIIWIIFLISLLIIPKIENKFSIYNFINIEKIEELSININFNSLETYENLDEREDYELEDFKEKIIIQVDKLETKEIVALLYFAVIIIKTITIFITIIIHTRKEKLILNEDAEEYKIAEKIKNKLNIKKSFTIIKSEKVKSPYIGGIFNPKIYISNKNIDIADLECLLTHEICHYKRKDNLINIFIKLFEILHFFNPVVIICLNRIEKDIELATDEMALQILDKNNTNRYCRLLAIMSYKQNNNNLNLNFAKSKNFVEERVNTIINNQKFIRKKIYIIILILIIIAIIFSCFTKEKIYIDDNDLRYLTININNTDYKIENLNSFEEYKIIKCSPNETIKLYGNSNLFSLSLSVNKDNNEKENNSVFFFNNNDIEINVGNEIGRFLYKLKVKYETKEEIEYCFIIEIE